MKCTKVLCATAVAATMIATMGSSVWASDDPDHQTEVTYTVTQSYTWSVPSEITFTKDNATVTTGNSDGPANVSVSENVIPENTKLQITAKGDTNDSSFYITNTNGTVLKYDVKVGNSDTAMKPNGTVLEVKSGTNTASTPLTFALTKTANGNTAEVPGTYTGNVAYTASVVSTTNASTGE